MAFDNIQPTLPLSMGGTEDKKDNQQWWLWIILIFLFFLAFSRGGIGGGNGNGANTSTVVGLTNEALLVQLNSHLNGEFNRINDRMSDNFANVNNGICNLRSDIQGVNYNVSQGFASITHQNDMNTCSIINALHQDGNATRALINDLETQRLREKLLATENALNNSQQTASIINALRPYPAPAFFAPNPASPFEGGCAPRYA